MIALQPQVPFDRSPPIKLCLEQVPGGGEDVAAARRYGWLDLLVVCDGMGGAGARLYRDEGGNDRSGAAIAAGLAGASICRFAERLDTWVARRTDGKHPPPERLEPLLGRAHTRLQSYLKLAFVKKARELGGANSRIRSRMHHVLPTTVAGFMAAQFSNRAVAAKSFWAGDSRLYALLPNGLRQMSVDDGDEVDGPLSNFVSADTAFTIHGRLDWFPIPVVLIAATDGAYGYLETPVHFEHLLLGTAMSSRSERDWFDLMEKHLRRIAGDDASIALAAYGFRSFHDLQRVLSVRFFRLTKSLEPYRNVLRQLSGHQQNDQGAQDLQKRKSEIVNALWRQYEAEYQSLSRRGS